MSNSLPETAVANAADEDPLGEDVLSLLMQIDREQVTANPEVAVAVEFGTGSVEDFLAEPKSVPGDHPLMTGATCGADENLSTEAKMGNEAPADAALDLHAVQILFGDQNDT